MSTTMNVGRILRHHQYQNVTQERNVYLSCAKRRMESRASSLSVLAMRQDMPQRHRWCSLMREGRRRSGVVANAGTLKRDSRVRKKQQRKIEMHY